MSRQLLVTTLGLGEVSLVMWLHTAENPPPDEWERGIQEIMSHRVASKIPASAMRHLVVSDGGAPSAKQRGQLVQVWEGTPGKIAVVTTVLTNPIKRGVATAITWLNPLSRFYEPRGFRDAVSYLDLEHRIDAIWREYGRLASELPATVTLDLIARSVGLPRHGALSARDKRG